MKRRTFLGRVAAAAGVLVAGAKAIAHRPVEPSVVTKQVAQSLGITPEKLIADFNEGTRLNQRIERMLEIRATDAEGNVRTLLRTPIDIVPDIIKIPQEYLNQKVEVFYDGY